MDGVIPRNAADRLECIFYEPNAVTPLMLSFPHSCTPVPLRSSAAF
jgi:hypothetical protein